MLNDVTAFAPATVANVGIGFDILGHTVEAVGDTVRLTRIAEPEVRIRQHHGRRRRTAGRSRSRTPPAAPCRPCTQALGLTFGFEMTIDKGIPLGSGMGGSAASAVAAVVAANALLSRRCRGCSC